MDKINQNIRKILQMRRFLHNRLQFREKTSTYGKRDRKMQQTSQYSTEKNLSNNVTVAGKTRTSLHDFNKSLKKSFNNLKNCLHISLE